MGLWFASSDSGLMLSPETNTPCPSGHPKYLAMQTCLRMRACVRVRTCTRACMSACTCECTLGDQLTFAHQGNRGAVTCACVYACTGGTCTRAHTAHTHMHAHGPDALDGAIVAALVRLIELETHPLALGKLCRTHKPHHPLPPVRQHHLSARMRMCTHVRAHTNICTRLYTLLYTCPWS